VSDTTSLREAALAYREGGAGNVPADNHLHWQRWAIWPRTISGVHDPDVTSSIVGLPLAAPIVVAPSAAHGLWHERAEAETAVGVRDGGSALVLSQGSTIPPEDVGARPYRQQLYLPEDRDLILPFIRRVEQIGAAALVVTVDQLPVPHQQAFRQSAAVLPWPAWSAWDVDAPGSSPAPAFTADDIAWLTAHTRLPVIAKGILHPDDALAVVAAGAAGVVVSNHGGRQLPGSVTPAEVLHEIVQAVDGAVPVHVDSGIRGADDVFRALCLGASTTWIGRPVLRQLEKGGAPAVASWLATLAEELASIFALVGVRSAAECNRAFLRERPTYQPRERHERTQP